jgi:dTDP-4-amino-4,6-dideoxygalactose transaminase
MPDPRVLLSPPDVGHVEEALVLEAMRSGWVAPAGPFLTQFETELAERTGRAHAVALSSGTAALHLSLLAVGVRPGDVVLMPTLTFVATANAVVYTGAEPCFVDVDPRSGNLDVGAMRAATERLRASGRRVTAVIPVDIFGICADYGRLLPAALELGLVVIEDAAEALGSTSPLGPAGSFGAAAALSFNGNKIMTTSGGGAIVTDDPSLADRVRYLSTQAREPVAHYEHRSIGYNYRLSNILAAIGVGQLSRLDDMIDRRRAIHASYVDLLSGVPGVRLLDAADGFRSNCWLTVLVVDEERSGWHADSLAKHLAAHDIETRPVWKPMHLQPVYAERPTQLTGVAENLFERGLVLPGGSAHTSATVSRVMGCVADFLGAQR